MDDAEFDTPPSPVVRPSDERIALVDSRLRLHEICRHLATIERVVDGSDGPEHARLLARAEELWREAADTANDMARELREYIREGYVRAASEAPTLRDTPTSALVPAAQRRRWLRSTVKIGYWAGGAVGFLKIAHELWKLKPWTWYFGG